MKSFTNRISTIIATILFILFSSLVECQNLVANGGFEEYYVCPTFYMTKGLIGVKGWTELSERTTPDYFNVCCTNKETSIPKNFIGYQRTKNGSAYIGFISFEYKKKEYRELIKTKFKDKLKKNSLYTVKFDISLAEKYYLGTNHIHAYVGKTPENLRKIKNLTDTVIVVDTINWFTINSFFFSDGKEQYLCIGNMESKDSIKFSSKPRKKLKYSYYYLDNVYVSEVSTSLIRRIENRDSILVFNSKLPYNFRNAIIELMADSLSKNVYKESLLKLFKEMEENPFLELEIEWKPNDEMYSWINGKLQTLQSSFVKERINQKQNPELQENKIIFKLSSYFDMDAFLSVVRMNKKNS